MIIIMKYSNIENYFDYQWLCWNFDILKYYYDYSLISKTILTNEIHNQELF